MEEMERKIVEKEFYLEIHDSTLFILQRLEDLHRKLVVPPPQNDWFTDAIKNLRKDNETLSDWIKLMHVWADRAFELGIESVSQEEETYLRKYTESAHILNHRNRNEYFALPEEVCQYAKVPELRLDYSLIQREIEKMRKHFQDYL